MGVDGIRQLLGRALEFYGKYGFDNELRRSGPYDVDTQYLVLPGVRYYLDESPVFP
jgi:hypothetical protein